MKAIGRIIIALSGAAGVALAVSADNHFSTHDIVAIIAAFLGSLAAWFMDPPTSDTTGKVDNALAQAYQNAPAVPLPPPLPVETPGQDQLPLN